MLERWDESKRFAESDRRLTFAQKEMIVSRVAYAMHRGEIGPAGESGIVTRDEVAAIVELVLPTINRRPEEAILALDEFLSRSGVLTPIERTKVSFSHHTFQEYYAALYLAKFAKRAEQVGIEKPQYWLSDWWEEVFRLYAGKLPDASSFLGTLMRNPDEKIYRPILRLASLCLREATTVRNAKVRAHILNSLLRLRTHGMDRLSVTAMHSEVGEYLLSWCATEDYYGHACMDTLRGAHGSIKSLECQGPLYSPL